MEVLDGSLRNIEKEREIENEKDRKKEESRRFVANLKKSIRDRPGVLDFFGPDFMK